MVCWNKTKADKMGEVVKQGRRKGALLVGGRDVPCTQAVALQTGEMILY